MNTIDTAGDFKSIGDMHFYPRSILADPIFVASGPEIIFNAANL